jgi:hypothetical protein
VAPTQRPNSEARRQQRILELRHQQADLKREAAQRREQKASQER